MGCQTRIPQSSNINGANIMLESEKCDGSGKFKGGAGLERSRSGKWLHHPMIHIYAYHTETIMIFWENTIERSSPPG
jgi:hypothetical protein